MNTEQEAEILPVTDPIEEPVTVVQSGGSEKKKIFFFGQPGCLKHSPIKTSPTENHSNHSKAAESSEIEQQENVTTTVETPSDDDDGDRLLRKISEALGDEPTGKSDVEKVSENDVAPSNIEIFLFSMRVNNFFVLF